jgi:hypothetical protein
VALALLLAVNGCAHADPASAGRAATGPTAPPSIAGTVGPQRSASAPPAAAAGSAAASPVPARVRPSAAADPPLPSGLPSSAPLDVRLGAACVAPGGTQRLVVETLPNAFVAFDNLYADDRDGQVHGGAEGRARSDARGRYVATWRIAPDTPPGRVRIDVGAAAAGRSAIVMRYYRLAARC